jgi:TolB-like protein
VAVLPFENLSGSESAAEKLTDYFLTTMTAGQKFETIEFGSLYQILRKHRVRSSALLTEDQIGSLTTDLSLDYILTGSALEYEEYDNSFLGRVPQVSFNCRLIDCRTNKTVWVANSNGRGDKGELLFGIGTVKSADNLARKMVEEAVNDLSGMFKNP